MGLDHFRSLKIGFGTNSEEERRFLQDRLRLFVGCIFLISGTFYAIDVTFSAPVLGAAIAFFWTPKLLHLAATSTAGTIWLALRRPTPTARTLRRVDAGATIFLSTCYALMALAALDADRLGHLLILDPWRATTDPLMACTYVTLVRALVIPSRPARTLWISALSMIPIVFVGPFMMAYNGVGGLELRFASLDLTMWAAGAVGVAGLSSRVIFGLRTEVEKTRRLGQYTLEEKIGEGGMGVVYRASPAMLRRPTAIKLLPPERMDEVSLREFEREVQLTAGLTHPNTVAVFDYGRTPDGIFYYAMEYLDGLNLHQLVAEDGPQTPARVIHVLQQVCGSLAEAHEVGLIHRDIKPENILLVERGGVPDVVKVVDFGLARRTHPIDTEATVALTTTNVIRGTPLYLSPEAIRNQPDLDGRSDLYAVGAVGFFLLTGRPVFDADTVVEVFSHHLHTPPQPPSRFAPTELPAGLDDLILHCLAKQPSDRPPNALTLQRALIGCPCHPAWSTDAALAWWAAHHRRQPSHPHDAASTPESLPTMLVDINDRVGHNVGVPE